MYEELMYDMGDNGDNSNVAVVSPPSLTTTPTTPATQITSLPGPISAFLNLLGGAISGVLNGGIAGAIAGGAGKRWTGAKKGMIPGAIAGAAINYANRGLLNLNWPFVTPFGAGVFAFAWVFKERFGRWPAFADVTSWEFINAKFVKRNPTYSVEAGRRSLLKKRQRSLAGDRKTRSGATYQTWVDPYTRSDGRRVRGHWMTHVRGHGAKVPRKNPEKRQTRSGATYKQWVPAQTRSDGTRVRGHWRTFVSGTKKNPRRVYKQKKHLQDYAFYVFDPRQGHDIAIVIPAYSIEEAIERYRKKFIKKWGRAEVLGRTVV